MWPRMAEVEGQRGLRIAETIGLDPGGGAAERTPAVGADHEQRRALAARQPDGGAGIADLDRAGFVGDPLQRWKLARARFQGGDQRAVSDIVAESLEPDLGRGEAHLRRPDEPLRVIDEADDAAAAPHADRQRSQTPSVLSAVTEPVQSAAVRLSGAGGLATSAVATPAPASAIAAVRPAGPPPTTATSAFTMTDPS